MRSHSFFKAAVSAALSLTVMLSAAGSAFAVTQKDIDNLKNKQNAIGEQKSEMQARINELDTQVASLMDQKTALDEKNQLAQQEIEVIDEQIALYDELIAKKAEEYSQARAQEDEQKKALRVRMRAMEESGSLSYIAILFNATDFTDLLARMDYVSNVMNKDKEVEESYRAAKDAAALAKTDYENTQEEQKEKKVEAEDKKAQLEQDIAEADALIVQLEGNISEYKSQIEEFDASTAALESQINSLVKALEAQQAAGNATGGAVVGTGSYTWPLPGYYPTSNTYGNRYHPILHYYRWHGGTDIGAPSGTPIVAADSGTVIISTYNAGGYGNYVTISHGGGRTTVYGHMSSRAVEVGDTVTQGQTIGYVGSTGLSTGPHLHFEVRVNGSTTDPMSYFS